MTQHNSYDVVIIGGAIMGSSTAFWLTRDPDFKGRVLVVERDPTYEFAATSLSHSSIRQQYSNEVNIRVSQFGADFVQNLPRWMGDEAPRLPIRSFGYMYFAGTPEGEATLRANHAVQARCGTPTRLLTPDQIAADYPFYNLEGVTLGSLNTRDEGYFEGITVFDWFRKMARRQGAEYIRDEVVGLTREGGRVTEVMLASGGKVACGAVVNAAGTRGAKVAAMAGITLPVEPRKRYAYLIQTEKPLMRDLPLTIDPSGVHVRQDGVNTYLAGAQGAEDPAADPTDFSMDHGLWMDLVWPILATRIPAFEAVKVVREWVGQYDYNTLDQNAILGAHPEVANFHLMNGFSGHGLQQSPAMGRGMAELLVHGAYQTLDLSAFAFTRIAEGRPFVEGAII